MPKKNTVKTTLFGESDSESEKELVIDDTINEETINDDAVNENEINEENSHDEANSKEKNNLNESVSSEPFEMDDSDNEERHKANNLSAAADEMLDYLKSFQNNLETDTIVSKEKDIEINKTDEADVKINNANETKSENKTNDECKTEDNAVSKKKKEKERRKEKYKSVLDIKPEKYEKKKVHIEYTKEKKEKKKAKKSEKVDVAGLVVRLLMPYYKNQKISSRELFKVTARHIVHQLLAIQMTGKIFFLKFA